MTFFKLFGKNRGFGKRGTYGQINPTIMPPAFWKGTRSLSQLVRRLAEHQRVSVRLLDLQGFLSPLTARGSTMIAPQIHR